jgi:AcrR family transcriptional regulator
MTSSTRHTGGRTPAGPDGRTRRRQERRDRVLAAALELFVERGYDNTTMDEIAERADVARATVFNHFARKSAILDEWALRRRERAMAAVAEEDDLAERGLREILARYLSELADLNISARGESVALVGASVRMTNVLGRPELGRELADYVRQASGRGQVRADVDADQVGLLLAAGYFATLTKWISVEPEPFDLRDELLKMVDLVLHGCLAREPD